MAERILVIEDEPDVGAAVRILLTRSGFEVEVATSGKDGLRRFHDLRPDLVVLDVGLPDLDGWGVLERIRDMSECPVLMLTARGLDTEKVRGLQAGADDYVTKPFSNAELVARVQAIMRRSKGSSDDLEAIYEDSTVFVDFAARLVRVDGEEVALTPLEYRLIATFVKHGGNTLSLDQLLEQAWDDPFGIGPERVKFAVGRLRKKMGWTADTSRIESVRGFGYRYRTD